jgi:hypothetical protein
VVSSPLFSLIFKFNKKRYLFGLTATLSEDKTALQKMKVDHIVLPAHPYHIDLACFYWQLNVRLAYLGPQIHELQKFGCY